MLELGAHMSISGGYHRAIDRALACSMDACQIFTKNQRQWKSAPLTALQIDPFRERYAQSGLKKLVAHDSYLINVASPDDTLWEKSRLALMDELDRCDLLGAPGLVSHPGAHTGSGVEAGIGRVAEAINRIHDERPDGKALLLLETTAGQGTALGGKFEEIAAIIDGVENKQRVGVCFDTCHVFAAGYDLRDRDRYEATMREFDTVIGLGNITTFHLNDSQKGLGMHVDRHAHIGEGELGLEPFRFILTDPRFDGLTGILETPTGEDDSDNLRNMATLRSLTAPAI